MKRRNNFKEKYKEHFFIKTPFINDLQFSQHKKIAMATSFPFVVTLQPRPGLAEIHTNPLLAKLDRKCSEHCQLCQTCICTLAKVVYMLDCKFCSHSYVGATNRMVRERMMEHKNDILKSNQTSSILDHLLDEHEDILNDFLESFGHSLDCLLYTSPSPRDKRQSRMPSSA